MAVAPDVTQRMALMIAFAAGTAAMAVIMLAMSVNHEMYAPGAYEMQMRVAQLGHGEGLQSSNLIATLIWMGFRKAYAIAAFAALGFFLAPIYPRGRRVGRAALFVLGFSAVIEIVQKSVGSGENLAWNFFDIACGFGGGWLGAAAWNAWIDPLPATVSAPPESAEHA